MDIKDIKQIVDLMKRSELTKFELEEKGFKLRILRDNGERTTVVAAPTHAPFPALLEGGQTVRGHDQGTATPASPAKEAEPDEDKDIAYIKSPIVGTFYRSPSPDAKPFVEIGTQVEETTVIAIVEAMKVMNELQAEMSGKIVEVLVENMQSVEYGQPLFKVKQG